MRLLRVGLLALSVCSQALLAQAVPSVSLKPATGTLVAEFIGITSVRELSDGRVLVSDPRDKRIVVGDFKSGTVEQVGRIGSGPREYPNAWPVVAVTGDSSLMADVISRRWLMFDGAKIVSIVPPDTKVVSELNIVWGIDRLGNLLTSKSPPLDRQGNPLSDHDSDAVVLVRRANGKGDTIARKWMGPRPPPSGTRTYYQSYERAFLGSDGWVAILRAPSYRVDWRSPDGKWTLGKPIAAPVVPMTAREKAAYMVRAAGDQPAKSPDTIDDWPSSIPPASTGSLFSSRDGKLLIRRNPTADHPEPRYDVINHSGILERQIALVHGESIVGFGNGTVYVAAADADGIVHLRRHPWP